MFWIFLCIDKSNVTIFDKGKNRKPSLGTFRIYPAHFANRKRQEIKLSKSFLDVKAVMNLGKMVVLQHWFQRKSAV